MYHDAEVGVHYGVSLWQSYGFQDTALFNPPALASGCLVLIIWL